MHLLVLSFFLAPISINALPLYSRNKENVQKYRRETKETFCPREILFCETPLNHLQTRQFQCTEDSWCPSGYKCCKDSCFQHNICKKSEVIPEPELCPVDELSCVVPLRIEQTRQFLCYSKDQCPSGYVCCRDSCFMHKICKKIFTNFDGVGTTPFIISTNESTEHTSVPIEEASRHAEDGDNGNGGENSIVVSNPGTEENETDNVVDRAKGDNGGPNVDNSTESYWRFSIFDINPTESTNGIVSNVADIHEIPTTSESTSDNINELNENTNIKTDVEDTKNSDEYDYDNQVEDTNDNVDNNV